MSSVSGTIEFWYEFASTYSYPAAMRIGDAAARSGLKVRWRPFLLGPIFAAQGWNDSPFNLYPAKGRYMWRDLERLCAGEGIALNRPTIFPQNSLLAARIALLDGEGAWGPRFTRAVYEANFVHGQDISDVQVLAFILRDLGLDAEAMIAAAQAGSNKTKLKEQVEEAQARGIFGAPSFLVGEELFWGYDRMDQAIAWATAGMGSRAS